MNEESAESGSRKTMSSGRISGHVIGREQSCTTHSSPGEGVGSRCDAHDFASSVPNPHHICHALLCQNLVPSRRHRRWRAQARLQHLRRLSFALAYRRAPPDRHEARRRAPLWPLREPHGQDPPWAALGRASISTAPLPPPPSITVNHHLLLHTLQRAFTIFLGVKS